MCFFGWGYPLISSIVVSTWPTTDDSGSFGLYAWCWTALKHTSTHANMVWGLFYPWCFLGSFLVSIFMAASILRLLFTGKDSSMKKRKLIQISLLMLIYCLYFTVTVASVISGQMFLSQNTSVEKQIGRWYRCVLSWRIPTDECPPPKKGDISGLFWWEGVSFSGCGLVMFLCFFVLRTKTWKCWQMALTNLWNGRSFYSKNPETNNTGSTKRSGTRTEKSSNTEA